MRTANFLPPDGSYVIFDLGMFGFPEIPYFAGQNTPKTNSPLTPHIHKDLMEICYFFTGERVYEVDGELYQVRANHVFVTWPNEVHSSGSHPHGKAGKYWMQIRLPKRGESFLGSSGKHVDAFVSALWNLPRRNFLGDRHMGKLLTETMRLCAQPGDALLNANRISANMVSFLLMVISAARSKAEESLSTDISTAVKWIELHPDEQHHINDLAERAHLSVSRFKNKFVEQVGLSPGDYILRNKMALAKNLLFVNGKTITEIAMQLGFSSHQHFSGTFKRYVGCTPSTYLAQHREEDRSQENTAALFPSVRMTPRYIGEFCHGYFAEE